MGLIRVWMCICFFKKEFVEFDIKIGTNVCADCILSEKVAFIGVCGPFTIALLQQQQLWCE